MILDIRHKNRVRVTPEVRRSAGAEVLEYVEIDATHERYGHGHVRLNREQVRHLAARFTQLDVAFGHHAAPAAPPLTTTMMPSSGAEVFPVTEIEGDVVRLVAVKIEVKGDGSAYIMPDALTQVRQDLERISRHYLGHGAWGGEDAGDQ